MSRRFTHRAQTQGPVRLATRSPIGLFLGLSGVLFLSGWSHDTAAEPPATPVIERAASETSPTGDEPSARDLRLTERDRHEEETQRFEHEGKLNEAVKSAEAMLAIEREVHGEAHIEIANSCYWLARLHVQLGDFDAARRYSDEQIAITEQVYGREGWRLAEAKRQRGLLEKYATLDATELQRLFDAQRQTDRLEAEGRFVESLEMARQALEIMLQRVGEKDYFTLLQLRRVAELSLLAGEFEQVERQLRDCAMALERAVGRDHHEVAATLDSLGGYYRSLGRFEDAAPYYRESSEILFRVFGPDHPQTGVGLNNLAVVYDDLLDYDRALPLYRESLRIALLHRGDEHDEVRITRDNLARVLSVQGDEAVVQGDYATAERLYLESTEIRTRLYGAQDWRTVDARVAATRATKLAGMSEAERNTYDDALEQYGRAHELGLEGKHAEALAEAEDALKKLRALFGESDRLVPACLNEIAIQLDELGRPDEALEQYRQAGAIFSRLLGPDHLEAGINLSNQALLLAGQGQSDEAIALFQQVVELRARIFGKADADYADAVRLLGVQYRDRGEYAKAEPLLREAFEVMRPIQVQFPELYLTAMYDLSSLYRQRGDYKQATPLLQQALQQAGKVFGERSVDVALYNSEIGSLYYDQRSYAEAVGYYERAIELYTEIEGRDSTNVATCLDNLGRLYSDQQDYERAEPLLQESLEIRRRVLGRDSTSFYESLANLAALYRAQGEVEQAEPLLVESVELCRKVDGATSAAYANRLLELALLYDATERATLASEQRAAALSAIEKGLADDNRAQVMRRLSAYAATLNQLADEFFERQDLPESVRARRLRYEALTELFGPEHWQTVNARFDLAESEQFVLLTAEQLGESKQATDLLQQASELEQKGHFSEALKLVEQALAIRRRVLGNDHRYTIAALERLSTLHTELADFAAAQAGLEEALALRQKLLGDRHPDVATDMASLGILSRQMGDFARAEEMYLAVLERDIEFYGEISTESAMAMNNLAVLYEDMGRPGRALAYARRSVEIHTQLLGEEHLDTINSLNTLAAVYLRMEDYDRAGPIFIRVNNLYKELLGPDHPDYIESVHTLATICSDASLYDWAEKFFSEALTGREKNVGQDHPDYARTLNGLALLHWYQDKLDLAIAEHEQVLDIRLRRLGPQHTLTAQSQTSLARAYLEAGRFAEAEKLLLAALETRRAVLEPASPHIGSTLYGLALLYLASDRRDEARAALEESIALDQGQLEGVAVFASEPSLRDFLNSIGYKFDRLLAMAVADPSDQATAEAALTWTLRRKALILDTLCEYRAAEAIFRHDPAVARRIDEVKRLRQQATDLALQPPAGVTAEELKKQQDSLRNQARDLEEGVREDLNRRRLAQEKPEITLESVAENLPPGAALVEYVRCPTYDFKVWDDSRALEDHYGAFVILPGSTVPRFVDLGPAGRIDAMVGDLRETIESAPREFGFSSEAELEADYVNIGRRLSDLVFEPLRSSLGGATALYIAPDRELNRVPFAALIAANGKYLLESYDIAYLSCGRDLLRTYPEVGDGTLVFAGPDYDLATPERAAKAGEMLADDQTAFPIELAQRSAPIDVDLRALRWNRLPGAEGEADDVSQTLADSVYGPVELFVGANALEDVFKASHSPRILHIATHGFFLTAAEQGPNSVERGPGESDEAGPGAAGGLARLRLNANPLLRSGIVLAGANDLSLDSANTTTVEDGWVTAEEISLLDFRGTELVVLSACESGLGDIDTRDGVYGLRRAFFHAGAHNLLTSLFKVPDVETRRLMAAFYRRLAEGDSHLAALHAAQRKILAERRSEGKAAHPFFWASFILVGEGE